MTKIIARVISQKGTCEAGHKVGDEFVIGQTTPAGHVPLGVLYTVSLRRDFAVRRVIPLGKRPG